MRCDEKTRPGGEAPPGLCQPPPAEARASTGSAVGALEAAIEHARAHFALVVALEQARGCGFRRASGCAPSSAEQSRITRSPSTRSISEQLSEWCDAAAVGVGLGQDDAVAGDLVDRADMLVVVADDFHMLADLAEQAALLLAAFAPAAEVAFETRLVLAAVVVIVAVELVDVALAPAVVVRVLVARPVRAVGVPARLVLRYRRGPTASRSLGVIVLGLGCGRNRRSSGDSRGRAPRSRRDHRGQPGL